MHFRVTKELYTIEKNICLGQLTSSAKRMRQKASFIVLQSFHHSRNKCGIKMIKNVEYEIVNINQINIRIFLA